MVLNDQTSNNNNLTNSGGVTDWTTNFPFVDSTMAVKLTAASTQYLYAGDSTSLSITGSLTLEGWLQLSSLPSSGKGYSIMCKMADNSTNKSYQFFFYNSAGTYGLYFYISVGGANWDGGNGNVNWTPSINTWYHVAVSYNNPLGTATVYVDGSQVGSTITGLANTPLYDGIGPLKIGFDNTTDNNYMDGKMDECRIWNTARTLGDINTNKSIELVGNETGLVAYWPFESTIGGTTSTSTSTTTTSTSTTTTSTSTTTISTSTTTTSTSTTTTSTSTTTTSTTFPFVYSVEVI